MGVLVVGLLHRHLIGTVPVSNEGPLAAMAGIPRNGDMSNTWGRYPFSAAVTAKFPRVALVATGMAAATSEVGERR